MKGINLFIYW